MKLEQLYKCEWYDIPKEAQANLIALLPKLQTLEDAFGKPLIVTSGFRTRAEHIKIYSEINAKRDLADLPELCVPIYSAHLSGNACDLLDDGSLKYWLLEDPEHMLIALGLWAEDLTRTPGWLHVQQTQYKSYKAGKSRFFKP